MRLALFQPRGDRSPGELPQHDDQQQEDDRGKDREIALYLRRIDVGPGVAEVGMVMVVMAMMIVLGMVVGAHGSGRLGRRLGHDEHRSHRQQQSKDNGFHGTSLTNESEQIPRRRAARSRRGTGGGQTHPR